MQNIDVRFNAYSNFAAVERDLATLQAQAASLANVFKSSAYARTPALVDVNRWKASTRAVHEASNAYRNAASSSGLFNTQQIRATSEAERYTKALQQQKLTLADMRKHKGIMREVYRDQLRMQRMQVQHWGTDSAGRAVTDIAVPRNVPRDLDNMRQRMGMFSAMAKSAGHQMVNLGKNIQWAGRQLTVGFSYPVALFGAAAGVMAFKVEDAFAKINKVYDVSAAAQRNDALRTKELSELRTTSMETATRVAKEYGMTVEKTLAVEQELAATGLNGKKLQESTEEVTAISALGDIDPSQTTAMVVALQTAFKDTIKDGDDLTNALNFMNATSNATSLSLQDIAEATPRAATAMAQLGVSVEEMTILMVSMREAGVDAAEGANALKSATTRILNPVAKAKDIYQKYGISLDELSQKSGGNLFEFLTLLGKAQQKIAGPTEKETARLRAQGVAALFGTYQNTRLTASLVNLADAQAGVQNQTRKAIDLQGESTETLAKMREESRKAMMENPAGKFKKAWASFQIQLQEMGGPFLDAATKILGAFSKVAGVFNDMPAWQKKVIMFTVALAAVAGPVIMLGGLFMNLAGQFVKGVGAIGGLLTKFKIFTTQEVAASKTTELVNNKLMTQKTAMQNLTAEIQVLSAAYKAATERAREFAIAAGAPPVRQSTVRQGPNLPINPSTGMPMTPQLYQNYQKLGETNRYPAGTTVGGVAVGGRYMSEKQRLEYAQKLTKEQHRQNQARLHALAQERRDNAASIAAAKKQAALDEKRAAANEKMKNAINGQNVAMGVGGIAMGALMLGAEGTAASIAKMALLGSIVVPAAIALVRWLGVAVTQSAIFAKNMLTAGAGARMAAMTGAAAGLGKFLASGTGIVTMVAAVGAGLYLWKKHIDGVRNSAQALENAQNKGQAALLDSTQRWAEATGQAYANYVKYNEEGKKDANNKARQERDELVKFYKEDKVKDTVGGKTKEVKVVDQWENMSQSQQDFTLDKNAVDLLNMGKSVDAVRTHLQAFLLATGESLGTADVMIDAALSRVGNTAKDVDWTAYATRAWTAWGEASDNPELRKSIMNNLGNTMGSAFDSMKTPQQKQQYIDFIKNNVMGGYEDAMGDMKALFEEAGGLDKIMNNTQGFDKEKSILAPLLEDADKLRTMSFDDAQVTEMARALQNVLALGGNGDQYTYLDQIGAIEDKLRGMADDERNLFGWSQDVFNFDDSVDTMNDFFSQFFFQINTAKTEAQKLKVIFGESAMNSEEYFKQSKAYDGVFGDMYRQWVETNKISKDTIAQMNLGLSNIDVSKLPQWIIDFLHEIEKADPSIDFKIDADEVETEVDKAKAALESLPSAVNIGLNIQAKQVGGIVQDAMSSVQNEMADSAMNKFNSGWDSRMASAQAANERASQALENRMEKRKDALENYFKKREKLINDEIKAEERADTIRQRLFDRERTRLQRLAELQNQNIDFNTAVNEGRLDDAAKIGNDMVAKNATNAMDDEQKAAEERSADRREQLEKRIEALNERREKQLKRLDKLQERMSQHMQRAQEAQIAGLEKQRAAEEASLQDRLELFKSYTGRNQKDLEAWMKKVGLSYDDFGIGVQAKGEKWSTYFQDRLSYHIRRAGTEVSNDNMWQSVGAGMAEKLVKGLGFANLNDFKRFVNTGQKTGGNVRPPGFIGPIQDEVRHTGGVIGSGGGSRRGVPNTYKGLHRSESMVLAQKGEYMVNRKDAAKNRPLLDAINSGTDVGGIGGIGGGVGLTGLINASGGPGYGGPAALMMGAMAAMFNKGLEKSFNNLYNVGMSKSQAARAGGTYNGKAYGSWSAEQMQNAAIIASVGSSMGMSKRDLMIGIMTSIAESSLKNINYGDRDSVGLFQQRTSQGWGTVEQIMNPRYSSRKFFEALKGVEGRASMAPWLAAQAVQRSAFSDGSNYQKWWKAAQGIFANALTGAAGSGGGAGGGYVAGTGGKHRPINGPVTNGLHGGSSAGDPPAVDMAGPTGRPVYAVADGVITQSRDIAGPLPTDRYHGDGPYGSFGRVISLRTNGGATVLYAHLSRRSVSAGQHVKGGARIGFSGNTGNSSGPHLHFGATNGPYAWLRTGGTIRHDNTPAILHKGETVLTQGLTRQFKDNVASGGGDVYDIDIDLRGAYIKEDVDIERAVNKAIDARENKRGRSRKVTD